MAEIRSVWHTGFSVSNLERSIEFFEKGLGLRLRHRQVGDNAYTRRLVGYDDAVIRVAQFVIDGVEPPPSGHVIELVEYVSPRGETVEPSNARIGSAHIALEVSDFDEILPRLIALGAVFLSDPVEITEGINAGGAAMYLRDPDGITIELLKPPPASR